MRGRSTNAKAGNARHGDRATWAAVAMIVLTPLLIFAPEVFGLRCFYHADLTSYFLPYHELAARLTRAGQWPLWNRYAFGGMPLFADGQTALLYPLSWLFLVLPAGHALSLNVVLQFPICGLGMFLLCRSQRLSLPASLLGAVCCMFSGFMAARVVHLSILAGAAMVPWIFWAIDRLMVQRTRRCFALACALVAVQVVAGHPQIPAYTALAAAVWVGVIVVCRRAVGRASRPADLGLVVGVFLGGAVLAGVQLVPWAQLAQLSPRAHAASYEFVTGYRFSGADWLLFLFPYGLGGIRESWAQGVPADGRALNATFIWERLAYVGLVPMALAMAAGVSTVAQFLATKHAGEESDDEQFEQRSRRLACMVIVLVGVLMAAGSGTPFARLVYWMPVVGKLRDYARFMGVAIPFVALLAGFAVDDLRLRCKATAIAAPLAGVAILGGIVCAVLTFNQAGVGVGASDPFALACERALQLSNPNAVLPLCIACATAGLMFWAARRPGVGSLGALVALTLVDLGSVAGTFNPTCPPDDLARRSPAAAFLGKVPGPFRVASAVTSESARPADAQDRLETGWPMCYGLEDVSGFNSLQTRAFTDYLFGPGESDVAYGFLPGPEVLTGQRALLDLLNTRYAVLDARSGPLPGPPWGSVFHDANVVVMENPAARPRAWIAAAAVEAATHADAIAHVRGPGFTAAGAVAVEGMGTGELAGLCAGVGATEWATVEIPSDDRLTLRTRTAGPRLVVVGEAWFSGWQATLDDDGLDVPIYRANGLLRAVVVPAGEHVVQMRYRPRAVFVGLGMSVLAALALVAMGIPRKRA